MATPESIVATQPEDSGDKLPPWAGRAITIASLCVGLSIPLILWLTHTAPVKNELPSIAARVEWVFYLEITVLSTTVALVFFALLAYGLFLGKVLIPKGGSLELNISAGKLVYIDDVMRYELARQAAVIDDLKIKLNDTLKKHAVVLKEHHVGIDILREEAAARQEFDEMVINTFKILLEERDRVRAIIERWDPPLS